MKPRRNEDAKKEMIRRLFKQNVRQETIAECLSVSLKTVSGILKNNKDQCKEANP